MTNKSSAQILCRLLSFSQKVFIFLLTSIPPQYITSSTCIITSGDLHYHLRDLHYCLRTCIFTSGTCIITSRTCIITSGPAFFSIRVKILQTFKTSIMTLNNFNILNVRKDSKDKFDFRLPRPKRCNELKF